MPAKKRIPRHLSGGSQHGVPADERKTPTVEPEKTLAMRASDGYPLPAAGDKCLDDDSSPVRLPEGRARGIRAALLRMVEQQGLMQYDDIILLSRLASTLARIEQLETMAAKETDLENLHPIISLIIRLDAVVRSMIRELGLSPRCRASLLQMLSNAVVMAEGPRRKQEVAFDPLAAPALDISADG